MASLSTMGPKRASDIVLSTQLVMTVMEKGVMARWW